MNSVPPMFKEFPDFTFCLIADDGGEDCDKIINVTYTSRID